MSRHFLRVLLRFAKYMVQVWLVAGLLWAALVVIWHFCWWILIAMPVALTTLICFCLAAANETEERTTRETYTYQEEEAN